MAGPWDTTFWRLTISQIPHIRQLFVTTPLYVVWPPTQDQLELTMAEWTAQLRRPKVTSPLEEIIINSAFGDDTELLEQSGSVEGEANVADVFHLQDVADGVGVQTVWRRKTRREWEEVKVQAPSDSNREEYLFGPEDCNFLSPWLLVDEVAEAKEWRENVDMQQRFPGFFPPY